MWFVDLLTAWCLLCLLPSLCQVLQMCPWFMTAGLGLDWASGWVLIWYYGGIEYLFCPFTDSFLNNDEKWQLIYYSFAFPYSAKLRFVCPNTDSFLNNDEKWQLIYYRFAFHISPSWRLSRSVCFIFIKFGAWCLGCLQELNQYIIYSFKTILLTQAYSLIFLVWYFL